MSGDANPHRSEGRYYIKSDSTCVTVTFGRDGEEPQQFRGQLVDLSPRGVRIDIDGKLEPGQQIDLKIEVPSESITLNRSATVRWQQPRTAKIWWTGCELAEPFDPAAIEQLATAHVLNRRRDPRYAVDKPAQIRTELSDKTHEARLSNYSKGGFCLLFDEPIDFAHDRVMLIVQLKEEEFTIPARVMWTGETHGAFGVGCAFSNMDGFLHLRAYAEPQGRRRRPRVLARPKTVSSWIALSIVLTIALQAGWLIHSKPQLGAVLRDGWAAWVVEPIRGRFHSSDVDGREADTEQAG